MMNDIKLSLCCYKNKDFDFFVIFPNGVEIAFSGKKQLSDEEQKLAEQYFPPCVFTTYTVKEEE